MSFMVEEVVYSGTENGENGKSCDFGRVRKPPGYFKKQVYVWILIFDLLFGTKLRSTSFTI